MLHLRSARELFPRTFTLKDPEQFTKEEVYSNTASQDVHLFYGGRDDVHNILKYVLTRVRVSLDVNMFGYDDELDDILMQAALDPKVTMLITLDKSQKGSQTEKRLLGPISRKTFQRFTLTSSSVSRQRTRFCTRKVLWRTGR